MNILHRLNSKFRDCGEDMGFEAVCGITMGGKYYKSRPLQAVFDFSDIVQCNQCFIYTYLYYDIQTCNDLLSMRV
jgi:hypothetical protein